MIAVHYYVLRDGLLLAEPFPGMLRILFPHFYLI
jgi:hypothetical protein